MSALNTKHSALAKGGGGNCAGRAIIAVASFRGGADCAGRADRVVGCAATVAFADCAGRTGRVVGCAATVAFADCAGRAIIAVASFRGGIGCAGHVVCGEVRYQEIISHSINVHPFSTTTYEKYIKEKERLRRETAYFFLKWKGNPTKSFRLPSTKSFRRADPPVLDGWRDQVKSLKKTGF